MRIPLRWCFCAGLFLAGWLASGAARAQAPALSENGPAIAISRATAAIVIDGELADPGWQGAAVVDTWWETNPGDNLVSPLKNVARIVYDDQFVYFAFEFDDPDPKQITSQLGDHDQIGGGSISDYGGVMLDPKGDGKVAQMFLANASGVQYDAISSDASGEDSSPDFFWDAAARRNDHGWQLEMRIPFASIRYADPDPTQWGLMLYRNRPREFRYQYFSSKLPRDKNCFICNMRPFTGLAGLPEGSHWIAAPYVSGSQLERAKGGVVGAPLDDTTEDATGGIDFKWLPNPNTVIDLTVNPDFSHIESDTAQITANERFAIFQPEKRPFFLESVDLFSTTLQAVYTRTFTDPSWGARVTGGDEKTKYTVLVGQDDGGGLVILPGSNSSDFALQEFESIFAVGRVRRELGKSFVSLLYSGREIDGGGSNRLLGPDFEWRPTDQDRIVGQFLWSESETPNRPDLASEWDGRELSGHAADLYWSRADAKWDTYLELKDIADEFRADNGFIPQVGISAVLAEQGYTFRPEQGAVRRFRPWVIYKYKEDQQGNLLERFAIAGFSMDALLNSFVRLELAQEDLRAIDHVFERRQVRPTLQLRPGKVFTFFSIDGAVGDEIDFANDRLGDGYTMNVSAEFLVGEHLRLSPLYRRRALDVDAAPGLSGRLLTAEVARLKAIWTFNSRAWLRLIAQQVETTRRPELWTFDVAAHEEELGGSLVFAYKLNWQTVLYVGISEGSELDERDRLEPTERQAFFKLSYAFRR
jgi:hypothetical protein